MEKIVLDSAIKIPGGPLPPGQEHPEGVRAGDTQVWQKAFVIAGPRAFDAVKGQLIPGFEAAGLDYVVEIYSGPCSFEAAGEYGKCLAAGCDEVVGGGRRKDHGFLQGPG